MSADLVSWLRSTLDEQERRARKVHKADAPWVRQQLARCPPDTLMVFDALTALNDPADVLRTVAAHRAILDRHSPDNDLARDPYCSRCSCVNTSCDYFVDWPCPDVLSLLSIYSDRPGFDPSWRAE